MKEQRDREKAKEAEELKKNAQSSQQSSGSKIEEITDEEAERIMAEQNKEKKQDKVEDKVSLKLGRCSIYLDVVLNLIYDPFNHNSP